MEKSFPVRRSFEQTNSQSFSFQFGMGEKTNLREDTAAHCCKKDWRCSYIVVNFGSELFTLPEHQSLCPILSSIEKPTKYCGIITVMICVSVCVHNCVVGVRWVWGWDFPAFSSLYEWSQPVLANVRSNSRSECWSWNWAFPKYSYTQRRIVLNVVFLNIDHLPSMRNYSTTWLPNPYAAIEVKIIEACDAISWWLV